MSRVSWFALSAATALVAWSCGYPIISYGPGDAGTGGGTSTSGSGGVTTSSTSSTSTSSTSTSSTSTTSSSSSSTGPACQPFGSPCGVGGKGKCSVDPATGEATCIPLGTTTTWNACTDDADCVMHSFCDAYTHVCKPICADNTGCPSGKCLPARDAAGDKINGLKLCVADCDPMSSSSCGSTAACVWDNSIGIKMFDCFVAGPLALDEQCTPADLPPCTHGTVCVLGYCDTWCVKATDCRLGFTCYAMTDSPTHGGQVYGFCDVQ